MTKTPSLFFSPKNFQPKSSPSPSTIILIVCGLVGLGACQPKSTADISVAQKATAPDAQTSEVIQPAPAPSAAPAQSSSSAKADNVPKAQATAAGGKDVSIAGGWVNAGGACDSGASVFFNRDGTYLSEGEKGTWVLTGQILTVTTASTFDEPQTTVEGPDESPGDIGEKSVLTVLSVTDDAARVILSNGSNASWTRCSS